MEELFKDLVFKPVRSVALFSVGLGFKKEEKQQLTKEYLRYSVTFPGDMGSRILGSLPC
jgi:hypothetical protein